MLPISTGVATVAMASGVEGATFFAPIFLLALGLPAEVAIGLLTEVFGFASGVTAYVRRGLVDYALARALLVATVPAAIIGSLLVPFIRSDILETILGMGLIAVAITLSASTRPRRDGAIGQGHLGRLRSSSGDDLQTVLALATFTIRSVIVGGQLGPMIATRLSQNALEKTLGGLFLLVGALMLWRVAG